MGVSCNGRPGRTEDVACEEKMGRENIPVNGHRKAELSGGATVESRVTQSGLGTPEGWPQGVVGRVSEPGYSSQEASVGHRAHLVCHLSGRPLPTPGSNQSGSSPGRQRLCAPPQNSYSEILTTP